MGQTIKEIKAALAKLTDVSAKEFLEYEADERAGVQAALKSRKKTNFSRVSRRCSFGTNVGI